MSTMVDIDIIGKRCVSLFKGVYKLVSQPSFPFESEVSSTAIQDEFGRFRIWGENIGAFQPTNMRSSLEHRLRDASRTRQHVVRILEDLKESLTESNSYAFKPQNLLIFLQSNLLFRARGPNNQLRMLMIQFALRGDR